MGLLGIFVTYGDYMGLLGLSRIVFGTLWISMGSLRLFRITYWDYSSIFSLLYQNILNGVVGVSVLFPVEVVYNTERETSLYTPVTIHIPHSKMSRERVIHNHVHQVNTYAWCICTIRMLRFTLKKTYKLTFPQTIICNKR